MQRGNTIIRCKTFVSQWRTISQGNPSVLCFRNIPVAKRLWIRSGEYQDFPSKIFCLTVPKHLAGEHPSVLCFRNFRQRKSLWVRGGGGREGISRFSVEKFLSHSSEKFRKGTLQCVTNFGCRKILCFRGLSQDFLSKFFCLRVPENFLEEHFCAVFHKFSGCEKFYGQELGGGGGGGVDYPSNSFCLTVPKNFVVQPFCAVFQKFPFIEKVYG